MRKRRGENREREKDGEALLSEDITEAGITIEPPQDRNSSLLLASQLRELSGQVEDQLNATAIKLQLVNP